MVSGAWKILVVTGRRVADNVKFTRVAPGKAQYPVTPMYIKHGLAPSGPHLDPPRKLCNRMQMKALKR